MEDNSKLTEEFKKQILEKRSTILSDDAVVYEMPSRECLVCERQERPGATVVNTGLAWLCPECKSRIKQLIYGEAQT